MELELLISNIGYVVSIVFVTVAGIFVLTKAPRRMDGVTFLMMSLMIALFQLSHILGTNTPDPELSRLYLMANLAVMWILPFNAHFVFRITDTIKKQRVALVLIYAGNIALTIFFLSDFSRLLLPSQPKMYFPNYYVAGTYYWLMRAYFLVVSLYFFGVLVHTYYKTVDFVQRNRYRYTIFGHIIGYILGQLPVPLVFGYGVDPLFSIFLGAYIVPVGYAAVRYQLANVNVVARRAFTYAIVVTSMTAFIGAVNYLNTLLPVQMGPFTSLILPGISSVLAVGIGTFVWKKTRESDVLKTEFISIISHKFRTPLTQVKWATEMLLNSSSLTDADARHEIKNIAESNKRLIELSNMLVATAEATNPSDYDYSLARFPLIQNIEDIIRSHAHEINQKELNFVKVFPLVNSSALTESGYMEHQQRQGELTPSSLIPPSVLTNAREVYVNADRERFRFVLHTLIENAIRYTPAKGTVRISIDNTEGIARITVADSGIGISEKEIRYVFTRFYRTDRAKVADTEGAGIGLYLSKVIIDRHGGKISALSEGENKGSTFTIVIPLAL